MPRGVGDYAAERGGRLVDCGRLTSCDQQRQEDRDRGHTMTGDGASSDGAAARGGRSGRSSRCGRRAQARRAPSRHRARRGRAVRGCALRAGRAPPSPRAVPQALATSADRHCAASRGLVRRESGLGEVRVKLRDGETGSAAGSAARAKHSPFITSPLSRMADRSTTSAISKRCVEVVTKRNTGGGRVDGPRAALPPSL